MKLKVCLLTTILGACAAFASPPDVGFSIDLAHPEVRFEHTVFAGNTPSIPVAVMTNGVAYNGFTGYSCELNYMVNDSASSLKTITGTVSGNIATFQALSNSLPVKGDFFCEVYFSTSYGASKITGGQGVLHVQRSPSSNAHGSLDLVPRINWDTLQSVGSVPWSILTEPIFLASVAYNITSGMTSQWSQAYLYGPRVTSNEVNIAVLTTGKTDLVTYNSGLTNQATTNLSLDSRITGVETGKQSLAAQILTNAAFQALHDAQANSNAFYLAQLTLNLTNQAATNAAFQALHDAQANTNAGFQSRFDAQGNSNAYFEAFKVAQGNSNAYFQGLFSAQVNSNIWFQSLNDAQVNTNIYFQGLHDAQVNSNAYFEAFKVAQEATNASLLEAINAGGGTGVVSAATYAAHLTNQAASNAYFQAFMTAQGNSNAYFQGLHTAQDNSNTYFQGLFDIQDDTNTYFDGMFTAQGNTNAGIQNQITLNLTNQAATNAGFETRVAAIEGAGYVTGGTNLYLELTVADQSKLSTNASGLTQATYTGVVSSVAYTGTMTTLVAGQVYAWGFSKSNAYGTSILSIAGCSLTATAAGAVSNVFAYSGTDTDLILTLKGDGSSKSDVGSVYVRQITNGDMRIAGSLYVGNEVFINGQSAFPTNEPLFLASAAYGITAAHTTAWQKASADAIAATNATASLQTQIDNIGALAMFRYTALADANEQITVLATGTNITATRTGTVITFAIPSGTHLISADVRWNAPVLGASFSIKTGTNDMANASVANRCAADFKVFREDNGEPISGAICALNITEFDRMEIRGLQTATINLCKFGF